MDITAKFTSDKRVRLNYNLSQYIAEKISEILGHKIMRIICIKTWI